MFKHVVALFKFHFRLAQLREPACENIVLTIALPTYLLFLFLFCQDRSNLTF